VAQRVEVTGWVGLVHVFLLTRMGNGCSAASLLLGWVAAVQTARAPTGLSLTGAEQIDLVRRIAEAVPG
jgi:hypothetical protein